MARSARRTLPAYAGLACCGAQRVPASAGEAGKATADYAVIVHTDSQLLVGQVRQGWKVNAANLRPLVDEAGALADAFGRCDIIKVPRAEIVRVLGH